MPASSEKSQQSVKYPPQPGQGQEAYLAETRSRIGSSIKRAEQAMMAVKSKVLREYDLSVAQYAAMTSLYYVPGQSAAQLARAAAVTPQTMATILARLDAKNLITRVPSEIHSRVNIVTLTDAGEGVLGHLRRGQRRGRGRPRSCNPLGCICFRFCRREGRQGRQRHRQG